MDIRVGKRVLIHDSRIGAGLPTGQVVRLVEGRATVKIDDGDDIECEISEDQLTPICEEVSAVPVPPAQGMSASPDQAASQSATSVSTVPTHFRPLRTRQLKRYRRVDGSSDDDEVKQLYKEQKQRTDGVNWSPSDNSSPSEAKSHSSIAVQTMPSSHAMSHDDPPTSTLGMLADAALASEVSESQPARQHELRDRPREKPPSSSSST